MSGFFIGAYLLSEDQRKKKEKIKRRMLRDHSNPFEVPDSAFIAFYRINKEAFQYILMKIEPLVKETSIPLTLQLAAALRFFGEGGYQRAIGKDLDIALERTTICKILCKMLPVLEKVLCPEWINLRMSPDECCRSKLSFSEKFQIPGVIGCIDGTHIKLNKPQLNEHLYFNRKGCFSINALIICDYNMNIRSIDACHPGSSHDSFIFNMSRAREFFLSAYESGERGSWLLGDSGYGLEAFLLTPYRNPSAGTRQHLFNQKHCKARNIVERVIGTLKSRFRCLYTVLPYAPHKVVKIINICSALHNICRYYKLEDFSEEEEEDNLFDEELSDENSDLYAIGQNIRDQIANNLMRIM